MAIQRNVIVAPFSVNTPLLEKQPPRRNGEEGPQSVAVSHQRWFQQVANGINATVQIAAQIPAHSNSPGQPGTIVFFATGFYLCVGSNSWLKFIGAPF